MAFCSWLKAFTTWMPDIFSSICPLSFPSSTCCFLNNTLVFFAIFLVRENTIGTVIRLTKVKIGLKMSIIIKDPKTVTTADIS